MSLKEQRSNQFAQNDGIFIQEIALESLVQDVAAIFVETEVGLVNAFCGVLLGSRDFMQIQSYACYVLFRAWTSKAAPQFSSVFGRWYSKSHFLYLK